MIAKRTANDLIYLVALSLFTFIWLYPLIEPTQFVVPAIPSILGSARIRGWLANSLIVSTCHTALQLLLCVGAAYAFARIPFKGKRLIWLVVLSGFMVPEQATFLPIYLLFADFDLHNTYIALILPGIASPIAVFLLTQFFRNIPADLDDAAKMAGATHVDILWRIILPLSSHVLAIIALYSFMANWNSYLWPLVSATKEEMWTITIALTKLVRTSGMVGAVTAAWLAGLPIMALFLVFQKRIFSGIPPLQRLQLTRSIKMTIPRSEYPRPQFVRPDWLCLNGEWQFEIDQGDSGLERGLLERELDSRITVPFCPESKLSGIENLDFLNAVWYRREVTIPADWTGRVLLHFQAVDNDATVWVNGVEVGRHRGGFSLFTCDLSAVAAPGETITLVLRARDPNDRAQPRGKQAKSYGPRGAIYVRTTGIWQTVWLEPVPEIALRRPRITPDVANSVIRLEQPISNNVSGLRLRATLKDDQGAVASAECAADLDLAPRLDLPIPEDRRRLWSIDDPHLYDLDIALIDADGNVVDQASSYAGLRSVGIDGKAIKINGEAVFQRLVLDQGYYPDGIMTAPSDEALIEDIELSMAAGFNGARLHQKVFEERFLYHADKLGYIVWGEFGDWGCGGMGPLDGEHQKPGPDYITQWLEVLERDYSHPSIVGWCPLNETWQAITDGITALDDVTRGMYLATKAMDTTRPVLDTSGYSHRVPGADVYDSHDYTQDPDKFAERHAGLAEGKPYLNSFENWGIPARRIGNTDWSLPYNGQPYFVSEFGGIWWNPDVKEGEDSWGYGDRPTSLAEFYDRFERLCAILLDDVNMFGYCYTQLTDIYQEQNGIYKYDRGEKFDMERIRKAQQRPAAIETKTGN